MVTIGAIYRNTEMGNTVKVCGVNEIGFRQVVFSPIRLKDNFSLDVAIYRPESEFLATHELLVDFSDA